MGSQRHPRPDRARRPRPCAARGRAPLSVPRAPRVAAIDRIVVVAADAGLRAGLESALAPVALPPAIVTAEAPGIAALRAAHPRAAIVAVGLARGHLARALDDGADAALAGIPRPDHVRAVVRAVARRRAPVLRIGPLELRPSARAASLEGSPIALSWREFELLVCLASAPGTIFTKEQLLQRCWGPHVLAPNGRALERCASRLRRRLGPHAPMLVTVWGIGYRLGEPD